jgi:uncharacterized membrane protein
MKKNTFYILVGCIAIALLATFWYSDEIHSPLLIETAFVAGVIVAYIARRNVTDLIEDERSAKITEKASLRTMQVFWVIFCVFSLGAVMQMLHVPKFPADFRIDRRSEVFEILPPRSMGYIQLGFLCLMIFLYVGFRVYYARKYGDWETDEE